MMHGPNRIPAEHMDDLAHSRNSWEPHRRLTDITPRRTVDSSLLVIVGVCIIVALLLIFA